MPTPSKYRSEFDERAAQLCYLGATDKILAAVFSVSEDTIRVWKKKHPSFQQAVLSRKVSADGKVAKSLYERATGYTVETQQGVKYKDKDGGEHVKVVNVTKHIEPHVTAMIFWLKNRQPELWRDVQQVEHSGLESLLAEITNTSRGLPNADESTQNFRKEYAGQPRTTH